MDLKDALKVVGLESKLSILSSECSRRLNALIDVQVFLQEDDPEGALKYLDDYLGE